MKKILTLIFGLIPVLAYAEPISFVGIDMSMTLEQQQKILTEAGYTCDKLERPWGGLYLACNNGDKQILPTKKKLTFSCENFNACSFSAEELAQAIVNDNFVKQMKYDPKLVNDGSKSFYIERYCGRGEDGDYLCVVEDKSFTGATLLQIVVEKGALGNGGIKFN